MVATGRKARHKPAVNSPCGGAGRVLNVSEDPRKLRCAEVGIEHEAGDLADADLMPGLTQTRAIGCGATVLPHDGAGQWFERAAVPNDEGLALVGDADGADVARVGSRIGKGAFGRVLHRVPDFLGVVLDPAWLRIVLGDLAVSASSHLAVHADGDRSGSGRALVQAEDNASLSH